jgi:hypothetical protein
MTVIHRDRQTEKFCWGWATILLGLGPRLWAGSRLFLAQVLDAQLLPIPGYPQQYFEKFGNFDLFFLNKYFLNEKTDKSKICFL